MLYQAISKISTPILLSLALLVAFLTLYITNRQARFLETEERNKLNLRVEATTRMANLQYLQEDYSLLARIIEQNDNLPMVITDANGYPITISNVAPNLLNQPNAVDKLIKSFSQSNPPIRITLPSGEIHYMYYGFSPILNELRYYPYIQLSILLALAMIAYLVYKNSKTAEQNNVWIGMARETAHQLGTPISSLMAWVENLKEDNLYPKLTDSLELDVERLQRVSERFSKIGSIPQLNDRNIRETIEKSYLYMAPRIGKRITLLFTKDNQNFPTPHNATLIAWVVENLIRNGADAIEAAEGVVNLSLRFAHNAAIIECSDSGKGMTRLQRARCFKPGYSTKTRGWGLGLSLSRRIVKDYHNGRIAVVRSEPMQGTTIRITLQADTSEAI